MIAARRCLEAMTGCDFDTDLALWKAAKRYASKGREISGWSAATPSLAEHADRVGLVTREAN